jgi:hypothetical protein
MIQRYGMNWAMGGGTAGGCHLAQSTAQGVPQGGKSIARDGVLEDYDGCQTTKGKEICSV